MLFSGEEGAICAVITAGKPSRAFYRMLPVPSGLWSASQIRQWPQAERARRSLLSQPPPTHRPLTVSDSTTTCADVSPGLRSPRQHSQLAQRLRSTA